MKCFCFDIFIIISYFKPIHKGISIISVAVDAPQEKISALSGKIGKLPGISAKTAYSNVISEVEIR